MPCSCFSATISDKSSEIRLPLEKTEVYLGDSSEFAIITTLWVDGVCAFWNSILSSFRIQSTSKSSSTMHLWLMGTHERRELRVYCMDHRLKMIGLRFSHCDDNTVS